MDDNTPVEHVRPHHVIDPWDYYDDDDASVCPEAPAATVAARRPGISGALLDRASIGVALLLYLGGGLSLMLAIIMVGAPEAFGTLVRNPFSLVSVLRHVIEQVGMLLF